MIGAVAALFGASASLERRLLGHDSLRRDDAESRTRILDLAMPGLAARRCRYPPPRPRRSSSPARARGAKVEALTRAPRLRTKPFASTSSARILAVPRAGRLRRRNVGSVRIDQRPTKRGRRSALPRRRSRFSLLDRSSPRAATSSRTSSCYGLAGPASPTRTRCGSSRTSPGCARSFVRPMRPSRPRCAPSATGSSSHRQRLDRRGRLADHRLDDGKSAAPRGPVLQDRRGQRAALRGVRGKQLEERPIVLLQRPGHHARIEPSERGVEADSAPPVMPDLSWTDRPIRPPCPPS